MSVYVDYPMCAGKPVGRISASTEWCHMIADTDEELHDLALKIGMKLAWFQDKPGRIPHYDLVPTKRKRAIALGAIEIDRRQFCEIGDRIRRPSHPPTLGSEE